MRPNVVLFGEMLPVGAVGRLESELATGFDVVVSMGTSSLFPYIAAPVYLARQQGGQTFEVNPGRTEVSNAVHHRIETGAAAAMGALSDAMGLGV